MKLKFISSFLLLLFLVLVSPARADEPTDQYLYIFFLIQQGDTLVKGHDLAHALAKYQKAQAALVAFHQGYPDWNMKIVSYRMNYLSEKISALSEKVQAPAPAAPAAAAPASTPQVKLLDAGAEPRKVLRLHPNPGDKRSMGMTMKMGMTVIVAGKESPPVKIPPMHLTMDFAVKNVSPDGDITYDLVMGEATVEEDPEVMPQVAQAIKSSLGSIKGLSGTGTVSSRGIVKSMQFEIPSGADPQMRQVMEQTRNAFTMGAALLPEEAVGPGARWQSTLPVKTQGMSLDQTVDCQLVSIEGDQLTCKTTINQKAPRQQIQSPSMPGMKVDLTSLSGSGAGDLTLDLGQIIPAKANLNYHSDASMGMNVGGQKQTMDMKIDMQMHLESMLLEAK